MNDQYSGTYIPHIEEIQRYCIYLAGSKWEAEDLMQETMLRIYKAIKQEPDRSISKAFVRRVVKNAWIDIHRKKQFVSIPYEETQQESSTLQREYFPINHSADDQISIRESFELLYDSLTIRQMVLILLVDIFQFTARETAQLIHSSEGAVKEGVKRARKRLHQLTIQLQQNPELVSASFQHVRAREGERSSSSHLSQGSARELFEIFLKGFRSGNPRLIYEAYNHLENSSLEVMPVRLEDRRVYFTFRDPDGHLLSFFSEI